MHNEWDVSFLEAFAKQRTVTVTKGVIKDGGRQGTILHSTERVPQRPSGHDAGTHACESIGNAYRDKRLVLANEDQATSKAGAVHGTLNCAAKRDVPEVVARCGWRLVPSCRSILRRATSMMIDC
jgi:hypothetical protein